MMRSVLIHISTILIYVTTISMMKEYPHGLVRFFKLAVRRTPGLDLPGEGVIVTRGDPIGPRVRYTST